MSERFEEQIRLGLRLLAEDVQPPAGGIAHHRSKRVKYSAGVIALACAAALIAAVSLRGGGTAANVLGPSGPLGPSSATGGTGAQGPTGLVGPTGLGRVFQPTVDRPLLDASQVSLAQAAKVLGAPLTLPSPAQASPADIGAVWASRGAVDSPPHEVVAVTFPSEGFAVAYTRPVPDPDALAHYESYARYHPRAHVVYLNGVPALTDTYGPPWRFVEFVSDGTLIAVVGTAHLSTLQDVAQSILSQAPTG